MLPLELAMELALQTLLLGLLGPRLLKLLRAGAAVGAAVARAGAVRAAAFGVVPKSSPAAKVVPKGESSVAAGAVAPKV